MPVGCSTASTATGADDGKLRVSILEELLAGFGADSVMRPPFFCDYGAHLTIGARTFANFGLVALDVVPITIGDDVQIGPNVQLLTPTHPIEPEPRRAQWEAGAPITIHDNVWLGGGVIVLPGVTIGEDTVVGAGSVVTRDLPAGVVAVGQPRAGAAFDRLISGRRRTARLVLAPASSPISRGDRGRRGPSTSAAASSGRR